MPNHLSRYDKEKKIVLPLGFEPRTLVLLERCSTKGAEQQYEKL